MIVILSLRSRLPMKDKRRRPDLDLKIEQLPGEALPKILQ